MALLKCSINYLILLFLSLLPERAESLVNEGRACKVVGTGEVDLPVAVQNVVVGGVSEIGNLFENYCNKKIIIQLSNRSSLNLNAR